MPYGYPQDYEENLNSYHNHENLWTLIWPQIGPNYSNSIFEQELH